MTTNDDQFGLELSRRRLLTAAGIAGGAAAAASLVAPSAAQAAPTAPPAADPLVTPPVGGLHLQFGADASSAMAASWHTQQPVKNPRIMPGDLCVSRQARPA
jgi:hypothetical protein